MTGMQKRLTVLLAATALAGAGLAGSGIAAGAPQVVGINAAVLNNVRIRSAGAPQAHIAVVRQRVALADEVQTGGRSQLQVLLLDKSVFTVGANARLTIDRFVYDPNRGARSMAASVTKGAFRFLSGRPDRAGTTSIRTPIATIGVRGTIVEGVVGEQAALIAAGEALGRPVRSDPETASLIILRGPGKRTQGQCAAGRDRHQRRRAHRHHRSPDARGLYPRRRHGADRAVRHLARGSETSPGAVVPERRAGIRAAGAGRPDALHAGHRLHPARRPPAAATGLRPRLSGTRVPGAARRGRRGSAKLHSLAAEFPGGRPVRRAAKDPGRRTAQARPQRYGPVRRPDSGAEPYADTNAHLCGSAEPVAVTITDLRADPNTEPEPHRNARSQTLSRKAGRHHERPERRHLPVVLSFFFIGLWLLTTTLLAEFSGWFILQRRYPNMAEPALLTLRRQSGSMGMGVAMNGVLKLSACPSGLRVAIWRLFGPFSRPFLVPWDEISAEPKKMLFVPMAKLRLGAPQVGTLMIEAGPWQRLSAHSPKRARLRDTFVPISRRDIAQGLLLQWAVITAVIATFFSVASRLPRNAPPTPFFFLIGFPALLFGFAQLIRYFRQRGGADS